MLIIIDKKIPYQAKENLKQWGKILELESEEIVYPAISGHPDIFMFQYQNQLIISPQFPSKFKELLSDNGINFQIGKSELGQKYPKTTFYNVSAADGIFIGKSSTTDKKILDLSKGYKWIESPQAYSRCNTIILNKNHCITSEITVHNSNINSLFVDPEPIVLKGFSNGFFGGCVGLYNGKLFLIGSLDFHPQGDEISDFCNNLNIKIIELYDGPLFDGGGIFFLER